MENPEAYLDVLTIRSLKERYHGNSDNNTVGNVKDGSCLESHDDLEVYVRDFAIDDSISDCFADSDLDTPTIIGVDCRPSRKIYVTPKPVTSTTCTDKKNDAISDQEVMSTHKRHNLVTAIFNKKSKPADETAKKEAHWSKKTTSLQKKQDQRRDVLTVKVIPKDDESARSKPNDIHNAKLPETSVEYAKVQKTKGKVTSDNKSLTMPRDSQPVSPSALKPDEFYCSRREENLTENKREAKVAKKEPTEAAKQESLPENPSVKTTAKKGNEIKRNKSSRFGLKILGSKLKKQKQNSSQENTYCSKNSRPDDCSGLSPPGDSKTPSSCEIEADELSYIKADNRTDEGFDELFLKHNRVKLNNTLHSQSEPLLDTGGARGNILLANEEGHCRRKSDGFEYSQSGALVMSRLTPNNQSQLESGQKVDDIVNSVERLFLPNRNNENTSPLWYEEEPDVSSVVECSPLETNYHHEKRAALCDIIEHSAAEKPATVASHETKISLDQPQHANFIPSNHRRDVTLVDEHCLQRNTNLPRTRSKDYQKTSNFKSLPRNSHVDTPSGADFENSSTWPKYHTRQSQPKSSEIVNKISDNPNLDKSTVQISKQQIITTADVHESDLNANFQPKSSSSPIINDVTDIRTKANSQLGCHTHSCQHQVCSYNHTPSGQVFCPVHRDYPGHEMASSMGQNSTTGGQLLQEEEMMSLAKLAVALGQTNCLISVLQQSDHDLTNKEVDNNGNTLLHLAAEVGSPGIVAVLLSLTSDPNHLNKNNLTPLQVALKKYNCGGHSCTTNKTLFDANNLNISSDNFKTAFINSNNCHRRVNKNSPVCRINLLDGSIDATSSNDTTMACSTIETGGFTTKSPCGIANTTGGNTNSPSFIANSSSFSEKGTSTNSNDTRFKESRPIKFGSSKEKNIMRSHTNSKPEIGKKPRHQWKNRCPDDDEGQKVDEGHSGDGPPCADFEAVLQIFALHLLNGELVRRVKATEDHLSSLDITNILSKAMEQLERLVSTGNLGTDELSTVSRTLQDLSDITDVLAQFKSNLLGTEGPRISTGLHEDKLSSATCSVDQYTATQRALLKDIAWLISNHPLDFDQHIQTLVTDRLRTTHSSLGNSTSNSQEISHQNVLADNTVASTAVFNGHPDPIQKNQDFSPSTKNPHLATSRRKLHYGNPDLRSSNTQSQNTTTSISTESLTTICSSEKLCPSKGRCTPQNFQSHAETTSKEHHSWPLHVNTFKPNQRPDSSSTFFGNSVQTAINSLNTSFPNSQILTGPKMQFVDRRMEGSEEHTGKINARKFDSLDIVHCHVCSSQQPVLQDCSNTGGGDNQTEYNCNDIIATHSICSRKHTLDNYILGPGDQYLTSPTSDSVNNPTCHSDRDKTTTSTTGNLKDCRNTTESVANIPNQRSSLILSGNTSAQTNKLLSPENSPCRSLVPVASTSPLSSLSNTQGVSQPPNKNPSSKTSHLSPDNHTVSYPLLQPAPSPKSKQGEFIHTSTHPMSSQSSNARDFQKPNTGHKPLDFTNTNLNRGKDSSTGQVEHLHHNIFKWESGINKMEDVSKLENNTENMAADNSSCSPEVQSSFLSSKASSRGLSEDASYDESFDEDVDCEGEDELGDDEDDDGDVYNRVKISVDNEDLPDEALRIHRLQRHLQSVKKLQEHNDDIIETVVTGTGEILSSHDLAGDQAHVNIGEAYPFKLDTDGEGLKEEKITSKKNIKNYSGMKESKKGSFTVRKFFTTRLFNHERVATEESGIWKMTDGEFEETYKRRNDVITRRRREMDEGIPWDQLTFSDSEDTGHLNNRLWSSHNDLDHKVTPDSSDDTDVSTPREFL